MRPLQVSVEVASYQKNSPDSRLFVYSVLIWGWKIPIPVVFVVPVRGNSSVQRLDVGGRGHVIWPIQLKNMLKSCLLSDCAILH